MKECNFCSGKKDISNKIFEDGSTYSDTNCKVYIQNDLIYGWCLKVAPVTYRHGEKFREDLIVLQKMMEELGFPKIDLEEIKEMWETISDANCASWLYVPTCKEDLVDYLSEIEI